MCQILHKPPDFYTLSEKLLATLTLHSGIEHYSLIRALHFPPFPSFWVGVQQTSETGKR